MKIHKVDQCCCGCSLEVGTKIIAWLDIIFGALVLLLVLLLLSPTISFDQYDDTKQKDAENDLCFDNNNRFEALLPKRDIETFIYGTMGAIVSIIFGVVLLVGATKKKTELLIIWIIVMVIELVPFLVNDIVKAILALTARQYIAWVSTIIGMIVGFLLAYYQIVVVSSFRDEILSGKRVIKV